jgi:hypothetical protein
VAEIDPGIKRIAKLIRQLDTPIDGVRRKAFTALESTMQTERVKWVDISNAIEHEAEHKQDDGKYTEAEMQEFAAAARAEGVEAGIKIGAARAGNGTANGHTMLPKPCEMAEYCHDRLSQLKDTKQRDFVDDMLVLTRRGARLSPSRLSFLASIYIKISGTTG